MLGDYACLLLHCELRVLTFAYKFTFRGIVSEDAVDDDAHFAVSEPALRTEPFLRLYC